MDRPRRSGRLWLWIGLALIGVVVIAAGWVAREVYLVYTSAPNPAVDYTAQFQLKAAEALGITPEEGEAAWAILLEVFELHEEVLGEVAAAGFDARDPYDEGTVDYSMLYSAPLDLESADREVLALERIAEGTLPDLLDRFVAAGPGLRPPQNTEAIFLQDLSELAKSRRLAKMLAARMRLAAAAGRTGEAARAFDHLLAVSSTVSHQMSFISHLVGSAIEALGLHELRLQLMEYRFDQAALQSMLQSLERNRLASLDLAFEGERGCFHDMVQRMYSDNGKGSGYLIADPTTSPPARQSLGVSVLARFSLRSRRSAVERYDELVDQYRAEAAIPLAERWQGELRPDSELIDVNDSVETLIPAFGKFVSTDTLRQVHLAGTRVMLALELYRLRHGSYPDALEALTPQVLDQPPIDPLHGGPFGYRLLEGNSDGRRYLLYSFGLDRSDDGGRSPGPSDSDRGEAGALYDRDLTGFDFVINTPRAARVDSSGQP